LVEFAILAPLLILLLFGIIEFGWAIGQQLDVRSKAREATRLSIVGATVGEIQTKVCANDLAKKANLVSVSRVNTDGPDTGSADTGPNDPGDNTAVTIIFNLEQITGMFGSVWGGSPQITSQAVGRIEQAPNGSWTNGTTFVTCP
jgi:Flp pilus assembly protein TadG